MRHRGQAFSLDAFPPGWRQIHSMPPEAKWEPAPGHEYRVAEERHLHPGWSVWYFAPGAVVGPAIARDIREGWRAAEYAVEDWENRGAPTQRMRANHMRYRMNARTRHPRLRSSIDSPAVEAEVQDLADYQLGNWEYEEIQPVYEHGQWFVTAWDPHEERQVTYSVVDTSSGLALEDLG